MKKWLREKANKNKMAEYNNRRFRFVVKQKKKKRKKGRRKTYTEMFTNIFGFGRKWKMGQEKLPTLIQWTEGNL